MDIAIATENIHPSTESCLEALQWLNERADFSNILEIGCGSGILSVACASIWDANIIAADISPKAVEDTQANIAGYDLQDRMRVVRSDGFAHDAIISAAPYDFIICNLLAELQARFAPDVKKMSAPEGMVLLSGILAWKAPETELAYTGLGFEIAHKIEKSPWVTLLLSHNGHN